MYTLAVAQMVQVLAGAGGGIGEASPEINPKERRYPEKKKLDRTLLNKYKIKSETRDGPSFFYLLFFFSYPDKKSFHHRVGRYL